VAAGAPSLSASGTGSCLTTSTNSYTTYATAVDWNGGTSSKSSAAASLKC
jgi:hypothetical protein